MSYQPTEWRDRAVERLRTYHVTNNPDGTITLTPEPGTVHEPGTLVNAVRLNNIENGIELLDAARIVFSEIEPADLKVGQLWCRIIN